MTLANMYEQGVRNLIAYRHNDACRHQAVIDVSNYPADIPVPWFRSRVKCGKCGRRGRGVGGSDEWMQQYGRGYLSRVWPKGFVAGRRSFRQRHPGKLQSRIPGS
jgi:hypothetical protein